MRCAQRPQKGAGAGISGYSQARAWRWVSEKGVLVEVLSVWGAERAVISPLQLVTQQYASSARCGGGEHQAENERAGMVLGYMVRRKCCLHVV